MWRGAVADAVAFWERGRLGYNGVLAAVLFAFAFWQDAWMSIGRGFGMIVFLGVVANVLYCAAYPLDLLAQATPAKRFWRQCRWGVWGVGTLFASLLAALSLFGTSALTPH
jgi:hypothetical protein